MARKRRGIPGLSFSWKRALGITAAKQRIARATGIPTTKAGRQQKIGRMLTGGGCLFPVLSLITLAALLIVAVFGSPVAATIRFFPLPSRACTRSRTIPPP